MARWDRESLAQRQQAECMLAVMQGGGKQFGTVRRRERGKGYRIDARPHGTVYTLSGVNLTRQLAEELLRSIRLEIARGKAPEDAVAPYLSLRARPNQILPRYNDWLKVKRYEVEAGDLAPRTLRDYQRYAREGGELTFWRGRGIREIDYGTLEDWGLWMAKRGLGPKSRRNALGALRSFLGWLKRRGALPAVPEFPSVKLPERAPKILTAAAQAAVLKEIPDADRGPYLVAALMGLRPGEVRALDVADVGWSSDPPVLTVSKAMQGASPDSAVGPTKTRKVRRLPMPPEVVDWLRAHVDPAARLQGAALFSNPRTGRRWSHWALRENWLKAAKRAGVPGVGLYEGTKHSFATDVVASGVPERSLQAFLGHADVRSTRRYAQLQDQALVDVIRRRSR